MGNIKKLGTSKIVTKPFHMRIGDTRKVVQLKRLRDGKIVSFQEFTDVHYEIKTESNHYNLYVDGTFKRRLFTSNYTEKIGGINISLKAPLVTDDGSEIRTSTDPYGNKYYQDSDRDGTNYETFIQAPSNFMNEFYKTAKGTIVMHGGWHTFSSHEYNPQNALRLIKGTWSGDGNWAKAVWTLNAPYFGLSFQSIGGHGYVGTTYDSTSVYIKQQVNNAGGREDGCWAGVGDININWTISAKLQKLIK